LLLKKYLAILKIDNYNENILNRINKMKKRKKDIWKNLLVSIFTIIAFILITEIILRLIYYDETNWYGIGPGTNRFYTEVRDNKLHNRTYPIEKEDGVFRIIILGDSFADGAGIYYEKDTFPMVLEKKFKEEVSENIEILNLALSGSDTIDQISVIEEKATRYNPDLLILEFFINDLGEGDQSFQYEHFISGKCGDWLYFNSYTYYFFETRSKRLIEKLGFKKSYQDMMVETVNTDIYFNHKKEVLDELINTTRKNDLNLMVVIFPLFYNLDEYPFAPYHNNLIMYFHENDIDTLDLAPIYSQYDEDDLKLNKYDFHPNLFGHKIAADAIFNFINLSQKLSELKSGTTHT